MTVTFKEPVNINNLLFAKYDGTMSVSDVKLEVDGEKNADDYKAITLDKTSGANVLSFINEVIEVKNDVTFRKVDDSTAMIEGTTGEFYETKNAGEKLTGAKLVLTLVEPETVE